MTWADDVNVKLKIEFGLNLSTVFVKDYKTISDFADVVKRYPDSKIYISGHTDWTGTDQVNQELSEARAYQVKVLLVERFGVSEDRIITKGYGESAPIADNANEIGRARNRRVVATTYNLSDEQRNRVIEQTQVNQKMEIIDKENDQVVQDIEAVKFLNEDERKNEFLSSVREIAQAPAIKTVEVNIEESRVHQKKKDLVKADATLRKIKKKFDPSFTFGIALGGNKSSVYYGDSVLFEHGQTQFPSFGIDLGYKVNSLWSIYAYAKYLPTNLDSANTGVNFIGGNNIDYENNIYGLEALKTFYSDWSFVFGFSSYIVGGISYVSPGNYKFEKYNHIGLPIGIAYKRKLGSGFSLDSKIRYNIPIFLDEQSASRGIIWLSGDLGLTVDINKRAGFSISYDYYYLNSLFKNEIGQKTKPEFFVQTLLLGLHVNF